MAGRSLVGGGWPEGFNWGATGAVFSSLCGGIQDGEPESVSKLSSAAGTYSNLAMYAHANAAVITARFRKNAANGNQIVATSSGGTGWFTDVTNSDACADGDKVCTSMSATGNPTEPGLVVMQFDATSGFTTWYQGRGASSSGNNGGNYYSGATGGSLDGTYQGASTKMTTGGTLSHITTWETNGFQTFKSVINGSIGNLSVLGAASTWTEDAVNSDTFSAGDLICYHTAATSTERTYHEGMRFVTSGNGCQEFQGYAGVGGNWNGAGFASIMGSDPPGRGEADAQIKIPFGSMKMQSARFYQYAVGTGPASFQSRVNGANGTMTGSLSSGATGLVTDVTNSDPISAGDKYCIGISLFSGGAANVAWVGVSMVPGSSTETSTGAMQFGPVTMAGAAHDPSHTATGAMAFGPVAMNGAGRLAENTTGKLSFGPVKMAGAVGLSPPGRGALDFGPISIGAFSGVEQSKGRLAFGSVTMNGAGKVPPLAGGAMQFGPVVFEGGGYVRVSELDIAVITVGEAPARVAELDIAALATPGAVVARVTEMDVAALIVPQVTTHAQIAELDVSVLAYVGPCTTSRCQVWKITRRDGQVFAFTSLDSDIVWRGVTFKTCKSLTTTAASSTSELKSAGDVELTGILDDASISDEDLYSGVFDDAYVEVWVIPYDGQVDDQAPFRQAAGWLGKVTRGEHNFTAEVIGPGGKMAQAGIVDFVTPACRWDFGVRDANGIGCPVDPTAFQITNVAVTGSVLRSLVNFVTADPGGVATWNNGKVIWQTGRNAGASCQVETVDFGAGALSLWDLAPYPPAPGDLFTLQPGCPKTPEACKAYGVFVSFGGFQDIPGPDALQSNADSLFT